MNTVLRKGKVTDEEKIIKKANRCNGTCGDDGSSDSGDGSRNITGVHDAGDSVGASDRVRWDRTGGDRRISGRGD